MAVAVCGLECQQGSAGGAERARMGGAETGRDDVRWEAADIAVHAQTDTHKGSRERGRKGGREEKGSAERERERDERGESDRERWEEKAVGERQRV